MLPHLGTMVANLRRVYRQATPAERLIGADWYPSARRIVAEWSATYALSVETVASVIAAVSPQCPWERNLIIADDILAQRPPSIGAIRLNVAKAQRLRDWPTPERLAERMAAVFPTGPKVTCFAANLAGDDRLVTVDTHASQAAIGDPTISLGLRPKPYTIIASAYEVAARKEHIPPAAFQAIVWVTWKRLFPGAKKRSIKAHYVS